MDFKHKSVLLDETIEGLNINSNGTYVDGTMGGAGHSSEILKRLGEKGRLICIDQDEAAINAGMEKIGTNPCVTIIRSNYSNIMQVLHSLDIKGVDGILLDLGVSSYQLDTEDRGFSYRYDTELDMRMDRRQSLTAKDIVNNYTEKELFKIIRDYGEEQFAQNIAKHIVAYRKNEEIKTTYQLNDIIKAAIPAKKRQNGHPSKKTFQAIRIECNRELEVLKNSLEDMIELLNPKGRLAIITFHSLEDRIVKLAFKNAENPCTCPPEFPVCVCGNRSKGRVVTRKPIIPSDEEMEENSRAKSAKLRVFEKAQ